MRATRIPYTDADPSKKPSILMPFLPLKLMRGGRTIEAKGLLDTGAAANVLPYDLGTQLGVNWDEQRIKLALTGNLAAVEARAILISAVVGKFPPVELVFAWTKTNALPMILGQTNFFMEFDVCFYRSRSIFEVAPAARKREAR